MEEYREVTVEMAQSMGYMPSVMKCEPFKSFYEKPNWEFFASHFSEKLSKNYEVKSEQLYRTSKDIRDELFGVDKSLYLVKIPISWLRQHNYI